MTVIQSSSSSNDPSKTPDTLLQDVSISIGMAKQLVSSWLNPSSAPLTADTSSVSDQNTITSEQSSAYTSNEELARTTQSFSNTQSNKNTIQTASRPSRLGLGAIGKKNPWQSNNPNQGILPHSTKATTASSSSSITSRLDKTLNAMTRKHQLNSSNNTNKLNRFNNASNNSWNDRAVSMKQSMDSNKKPFSHNRYQPMQQQEDDDDDMECSKYSAIKKHP